MEVAIPPTATFSPEISETVTRTLISCFTVIQQVGWVFFFLSHSRLGSSWCGLKLDQVSLPSSNVCSMLSSFSKRPHFFFSNLKAITGGIKM